MANAVNVTNDPANDDRAPNWSPDGAMIAFERNDRILVIDADGSNLTILTNSSEAYDYQPSFSPDGTKIAFTRSQPDPTAPPGIFLKRDIFVMNADGSNPTNLSNNSGGKVSDASYRSWAPDGTRIAFTSYGQAIPPSGDIYVVGTDGSNPINLTGGSPIEGIAASNPAWSPGGTRIAFWSIQSDGAPGLDIFVINIDSSNPTTLTNFSNNLQVQDFKLAWSPDGTRIAFARRGDILVISADGTNLTNLTRTQQMDNLGPAWSPNGAKIAFSRSEAGGNRELNAIFVMEADGSNPTNVTDTLPQSGLGVDFEVAWSPDSTKIAFSSTPDVSSSNRDIFVVDVPPDGA
jgi:Tol biopolymer transport system component